MEQAAGFLCLAVYRPDPLLLERQIESIRLQTIRSWTCVVGIDGADPTARTLVEELTAGDARFRIREYEDNAGFYRNFERLLAEVPVGVAWVALADQDDDWFETKLEVLLPHLKTASLVSGQVVVTQADGTGKDAPSRRRRVPLAAEFLDNQITGSASIFRRDLLELALPFPSPTDLAFHDHWLGTCALLVEGIAVIDQPTQYYVQHATNVIGEERSATPVRRAVGLLRRGGGNPAEAVRYLREHRWGWRVNMARSALDRTIELSAADRRVVAAFARGRFSVVLARIVAAEVWNRRAPVGRASALLIGSLFYSA